MVIHGSQCISNEWLSFRLNQLSNLFLPSPCSASHTPGRNYKSKHCRISRFSSIQSASEAPLVIENSRPSSTWPETGTISFQNLQIRYAETSLRFENVTCTLPGSKKVGVVGRTGSGKSTLIQALFRIVEPREGSIIIDEIDICKTAS
ncbi:ATP-binding cassette, sub-C (CFTR MRP), member 9 [Datura stramonium]|uniref:ATP-binding cassette, sub-C (CFTR MRP), member 9 n=1 Tax=Datura stramonium TaxID=4076 RepID=A0ABS8UVP6_DATST|nr:ATP-binding cassette, sub-C (CFTR MRP), member 9 [Datura stramonium]